VEAYVTLDNTRAVVKIQRRKNKNSRGHIWPEAPSARPEKQNPGGPFEGSGQLFLTLKVCLSCPPVEIFASGISLLGFGILLRSLMAG